MTATETLEQENARLREQLAAQWQTLEAKQQRIQLLEELLIASRQRQFGPSSEKQSPQQSLFNEAEESLIDAEGLAVPGDNQVEAVSSHTRPRKKRVSIPGDIERDIVLHDLADTEKVCPYDGTALRCIGEETHEQLDIIPAQIKALRHVRKKYACPCCEQYVVTTQKPKQPIEKSIAAPGLLAHIAVSKCADVLPLYRQTTMFNCLGIELDRTSLANWMVKCGELIQPLLNRLQDHLLAQPVIHMDETPVQVLNEPGKTAESQSYMWIIASKTECAPAELYHYSVSCSQATPRTLLAGYQGALMVDGYSGYQGVCRQENITRLGCWAHARRKFIEVQKAQRKKTVGRADKALGFIQRLYRLERQGEELSSEARWQLRQEKAKPVIDKLQQWLIKSLPQVPPQSAIGKALTYLHNQWEHLTCYLDEGNYPIDNNRAENAIRPFVVGRKNWLFSQSQAGAHASANLYSLIETAKANDVEPYGYLREVFTQLPTAESLEEVDALLPWHYKGVVR